MNENTKILLCYNEPFAAYQNYLGKTVLNESEKTDLSETEFIMNLNLIETLLKKKYPKTYLLGFDGDIPKAIKQLLAISPDIIFNFVESIEGNSRYEVFVTGMFDLLGFQYTGNSSLCLGNCLIKYRTKQLLKFNNINSPDYKIFRVNDKFSTADFKLKFPVILKLAYEDASIGISEFSVVHDLKTLRKQVNYLLREFKQDVLAEEYIKGRELNVSIFAGEVLPISEILFKGLPGNLPKIVTYEAKWSPESVYYKYTNPKCPADLTETQASRIKKVALEAYNALGCRDYVRVDIRLSQNNKPYVIEVNPNPDISPGTGFVRSAKHAGYEYEDILYKLAELAYKRKKYDQEIAA